MSAAAPGARGRIALIGSVECDEQAVSDIVELRLL
jgi:hypothetical protein